MEKKIETKLRDNGTYIKVETIKTTPEDGFVHQKVIRPVGMKNHGKYYKGYSTTKFFSTNDPRITRPLAYCMCILFLIIGIILLLFRSWFFGIIFVATGIFSLITSKKDIDSITNKLKKQGYDVTIDSEEEKEQLKKEFVGTLNSNFNEAVSQTFTKDNKKWFMKIFISLYSAITLIISLLLSIFINIFLGLFVFIILLVSGLLYYYLILKIFKH